MYLFENFIMYHVFLFCGMYFILYMFTLFSIVCLYDGQILEDGTYYISAADPCVVCLCTVGKLVKEISTGLLFCKGRKIMMLV